MHLCFVLNWEKTSPGLDCKPRIKTLGELMQLEYKQGFVLLASQDPTWIMAAMHSKQEDNTNTGAGYPGNALMEYSAHLRMGYP